jgi:HlyD family secretion protein
MTPSADGAARAIVHPALLLIALLAMTWPAAASASTLTGSSREAALLVGEVQASQAEAIYTPPSNSPQVLRYYVAEGTRVSPGDVLVRIDPGNSASQVLQLTAQIEQLEARAAKDVAELDVKALDAERAELDAELALAKARIDASIPRSHLSALDADRHAGELERAEREHALKRSEREAARLAVQRRRDDARLEIGKLAADLAYNETQVIGSEQRAERAGIVVQGFDRWRGQRYEEGSTAFPGQKIGEVVGDGPMEVRAWALEPDRTGLQANQSVRMAFDALPGTIARGRIARISGAPEAKAEWGDGRYFTIDITLDDNDLPLRPGMSVRIEPLVETEA